MLTNQFIYQCRTAHIDRIIDATMNLWKQENSVCKPCHGEDTICLFCYCPLYECEECGGNYVILPNGVKDCSTCKRPHQREFVQTVFSALYTPECRERILKSLEGKNE